MKILITGGAGYLGSILAETLLPHPYPVTVLDTFVHGENSLAHLAHYSHFNIVNGDVRDLSVIAPLLLHHDVIIPLAAVVGAPACDHDMTAATSTNHWAITQMCKLLSKEQWVLYPNTNSGYGTTGEAPCDETTPLRPISLYGDTKKRAEDTVMQRENSLAFRLATVFGASPRMRTDLLVNDFVLRAVRDKGALIYQPHARRNYVHVRDVALAFRHGINQFEQMRGQVYNCGDTRANCTKLYLAYKIHTHTPFTYSVVEGSDGDKRDYLISNEKLENTGWMPQFSLDDGIDELVKLYRGLRVSRYGNA